jgi:uncharacterized protein (UPF0261 family)
MYVSDPNADLCAHHILQDLKSRRQAEASAQELLTGVQDLATAEQVNLFLGNLIKEFVHKRIDRHDAVALAYMSQLILNSLGAADRQAHPAQQALIDRLRSDAAPQPAAAGQLQT